MPKLTVLGCLSFFYLQVVHPHLPLGQLDSPVGEGGPDGRHRSLLAVSVRHAGPQQLSPPRRRSPSAAFGIQPGPGLWFPPHGGVLGLL